MKFSELKKRINGGDVRPLYLLTGSDEYLRSNAVRLLKRLVTMPELNAVTLESPSATALRDALNAVPMMSEKRLVAVDRLIDVSLVSSFGENETSTVLVVTAQPEVKKGKKAGKREEEISRFLSRAEVIDCSPLDTPTVFGWMAAEAKKYDVTVESEAAKLLAEYCGNDMSRISGEFGKLASYRTGGTMTADDVRALVTPEHDYAVWQLSNAVAAGNARLALDVYDSFGEDLRKPETLFGTLSSHFRKMYYCLTETDDDAIKKGLGVRDNALYAVRREAGRFGEQRLKRILLVLAELDEDMKNGTVPREVASETIVVRTVNEI